jgi:hypothetical protein
MRELGSSLFTRCELLAALVRSTEEQASVSGGDDAE